MNEKYFMGQERRKHERVSYHAPCRYEISSDENHSAIVESGTSFIKNISLGGMLIEMRRLVAVNSCLDLEVVLPTTAEPIRAEACVIWTRKLEEEGNRHDVGMSFVEINPENKEKIASLKRRIENIEEA